MADNVTGLFPRGSTYNGPNKTLSSSYGVSVGIEGHIKAFDDIDPTSGSPGVKTKRSDRTQKCMVVRNVSGIALLPKRMVSWAAGFVGKRVDGYTITTSQQTAGVVDEHLSSGGVRDEDLFWLQVAGPCLVNMAYTEVADVSAGDFLDATTVAASTGVTAGRPSIVVATSSLTVVKAQILNTIGRAMSAVSSSSTTGSVLVDLQILKD